MPTAKPTVKSLRAAAKSAEVDGWEEMDREELEEALSEIEDDETEEDIDDDEVEDDVDEESDDDEDDEDDAPVRTKRATTKKAPVKKAPVKKAPVKKAAASKKAPTTKAAAKPTAAEENENGNPYRKDSNLYYITEALMKGGKRSVMVTRLLKKIDLKPRVKGGKDYDEAAELDYRIVRACQDLKNSYGFVIEREGRGIEQKVQAIAPQDQ